MSTSVNFQQPAGSSENDRLLIAVMIALLVHAFIILGINFSVPESDDIDKTIEVTLAHTPVSKAPEKAQFLAQANQIGAGQKQPNPEPPKQQIASQGTTPNKQPAPKPVAETKVITKKIVTTVQSSEQKSAPVHKTEEDHTQPAPQISVEALQQQISQLGTEIMQHQQNADFSKIKHVESVSTHRYVAAQYMKDWQNKVERTGNLNYPEVARKKNFSATLTMEVGIKEDGGIYSIRIKQSSGVPELDQAAKKIVRMSGPFPPLPMELQKELDVLIITRVWKFSDESGITTR